MANLNLNLVIKLIDQATAPVRRVGQLVSGLQRPFKSAQMAAGDLLRDLRSIALVGAAAVSAIGLALFQSVRRFANVGDAALETSQKLGISVPSFQRLGHAAKQGGVDAAALEDALKFLNLSSSAAADGAKQDAQAFDLLGVSFKDAEGRLRPLDALLPEIADAFQKMPDGARKSQVAVALFGRSGLAMIPMLNEGAAGLKKWADEADQLGIVMSQSAAENADTFNDALNTLNQSVFGLSNGIAAGLLPELTGLVEMLTQMIRANKPEILRRTQEIFAQISAVLPEVIKGIGDFAKFLGDIAAAVGPVVDALGGFNGLLDLMAIIMITRVAIAIWSAVSAVWALNGAMLANPVGLVIALIAVLAMAAFAVFRNWKPIAAFFTGLWDDLSSAFSSGVAFLAKLLPTLDPVSLIIRHWVPIVGFFTGIWDGISRAFAAGVEMVWNILPPWFRQVLRGAAFVIRTVANVAGGGPAAPGDDSPARPRGPAPAVGGASRGGASRVTGAIDVRVYQDGRPPQVSARSADLDFGVASMGGVQMRGGG
ncbi:phage tail tape measure protein [Brevundimonas vitis]|uniref:Phage tail tape measure protein n=1 Tax=Brevundimonas vitisensis TaxID=2800818 RepID=A0ABX7BSF7_9CAUL|nr:phage tail tape measure protein [Brevundimonas vitisensis]QQQ19668.1 phage tail tape measure protein [Brevundimonas vitisensis]